MAPIGPSSATASWARGCPSRSSRPPNRIRYGRFEIAPAIPAATVEISMSRFFTCASSCASTPSSSSRGRYLRIPAVTATTACSGLRPVANALGCSWGAIATLGMGSPARCRSRSTMA